MIAVDTSVWIDHLRRPSRVLNGYMLREHTLMHPMVLGELACGMMATRERQLRHFRNLPRLEDHPHESVTDWIGRRGLMGQGVGFVDAHLLYATVRRPGTSLWTRDKRLGTLARTLGLANSGEE